MTTIPAVNAPTDLGKARLAIVVGNQIMSIPAMGMYQPFDADLSALAGIGVPVAGDLIYSPSNGVWARLAKGTALQHLRMNAAGTAPEWATITIREVLTANRTYYVRTDGSDTNNGLANTAGGAFLTIQKAIDVIATLDLAGNTVTVQVGAGTYTGANKLKSILGGDAIIVGDEATPSNVVVNAIGKSCFAADFIYGTWHIRGMKLTGDIHGIECQNGSCIKFQAIDFGSITYYHVICTGGAVVVTGNYRISGGCITHLALFQNGTILCQGRTVTITGSPHWGGWFISATSGAQAGMDGNTYSGSATGARYLVGGNGSINTSGAGANYFPGNTAGTATPDQEYT